ncbi:hypothetical protein Dimus_005714, partial [Dionaea muscipula]
VATGAQRVEAAERDRLVIAGMDEGGARVCKLVVVERARCGEGRGRRSVAKAERRRS